MTQQTNNRNEPNTNYYLVLFALGFAIGLLIPIIVMEIDPKGWTVYSVGYNQSIADNNHTFYNQGMNDTVNFVRMNAARCENLTLIYPEYNNQQLHYVVWECLRK